MILTIPKDKVETALKQGNIVSVIRNKKPFKYFKIRNNTLMYSRDLDTWNKSMSSIDDIKGDSYEVVGNRA